MGYSILWIMMLHFRFITLKPLGFVAQYGFAGVEIFIFVSGLGLFYSLEKDSQLMPFYKKRLRRIFPAYYLIGIAASIFLYDDGVLTYLFRYTTLGFWTGLPYFEWYVPSIVGLYLAAPLLKKLVSAERLYVLPAVSAVILAAAFAAVKFQLIDRAHYFLFYRTPAFLFGMASAMLIKRGAGTRSYWLTVAAGLPLFVLLYPMHKSLYDLKYLSVFFLLPLFMAAMCQLSKVAPLLSRAVRPIGAASLEIYLIQTLFFSALNNGQITVGDGWHDIVTVCLMVICSVGGIALHRLLP